MVIVMANIQGSINKLLYALKLKGENYKINTEQFYMEDKLVTKYILYQEHPKKDGEKFYSKVKLLKYLVTKYKEGGNSE